MDEQFPGRLGHVQVVLKEPLDGEQRLLVQAVNGTALEHFLQEHVTERGRQLVNEAGTAEVVVADNVLFGVKHLADFQRHLGLFEGPGQGEVLMHHDARMTTEWEHCTSAVLDYFELNDVTLIGISLGGYLATRAAAYEKRISRLVMYDLIYDFYGAILNKMGSFGKFFDYLTRHPKSIFWKSLNKKLDKKYFTKWLLLQGYAIYENISTPCEYFNHIRKYNTRDISKRITQDTLVLAGEADIYTVFYQKQLDALVNAKSVTGRLFTAEENADHHCQVGNMGLLLDTITEWIEEKK